MNCKSAYPDCMGKPPPIRAVLAANLRALMSRQHPEMTEHELARLAKRHGGELSQSTVHRMLHGQTSCGVDHLATLAMVFELEPWQLLVPDLDPTDPPVLASVSPPSDRPHQALSVSARHARPGRAFVCFDSLLT